MAGLLGVAGLLGAAWLFIPVFRGRFCFPAPGSACPAGASQVGRSGLPPPGLFALLTGGARGGTIPDIPQLSAAAWSEKLISTKQLNLVLITGDDVNV